MQEQINKYHAKRIIIDGYQLDSQFEGKVYRTLSRFCGSEHIIVHPKVKLFSRTSLYPTGKNWAIDFKVATTKDTFFVEAKGRITLELNWQLSALEVMRPDIFNQFVMVFENPKEYETKLCGKLTNRTVTFDRFTFPQVMSYSQFLAILSGGT